MNTKVGPLWLMSRQKNAVANPSSVMQKLLQSENEAETISLQPNISLKRPKLSFIPPPHQEVPSTSIQGLLQGFVEKGSDPGALLPEKMPLNKVYQQAQQWCVF